MSNTRLSEQWSKKLAELIKQIKEIREEHEADARIALSTKTLNEKANAISKTIALSRCKPNISFYYNEINRDLDNLNDNVNHLVRIIKMEKENAAAKLRSRKVAASFHHDISDAEDNVDIMVKNKPTFASSPCSFFSSLMKSVFPCLPCFAHASPGDDSDDEYDLTPMGKKIN